MRLARAVQKVAQADERFLSAALGRVKAVVDEAPELVDMSAPMLIWKSAGSEASLATVRSAADDLLRLLRLSGQLDGLWKQWRRTVGRAVRAVNPYAADLALPELRELQRRWDAGVAALAPEVRRELADGVAHAERELSGDLAVVERAVAARRAPSNAPVGPASSARRQPDAAPRAASEVARVAPEEVSAVYEVFTELAAAATGDLGAAYARVRALVPKGSPVWTEIVRLAKSHTGATAEDLASAIQGALGEALALAHPWVLHLMASGLERARLLAGALGPVWRVVVVPLGVRATKDAAPGSGALYDASIWLVRSGKDACATPVWSLEVKSGGVAELVEQLARDLRRESQHAVTSSSVTMTDRVRVPLRDLRTVLAEEGLDPVRLGAASGDTQRVVVGPRVPSDFRIAGELPPGVAAEMVRAQLTKAEMNAVSRAFAARVRAAVR